MNVKKATESSSGRELYPNFIKNYDPNVKSSRPSFTQNHNLTMQVQRPNFTQNCNTSVHVGPPNFPQKNTYMPQQHVNTSRGFPRSRLHRGHYTPRQQFSPRGRGFSVGYRQSFNNNYGVNKSCSDNQNYGYQFYCDTCDRSFADDRMLQVHISEHVPCGLDGCTYVANQAAVSKHIKHQHTSGLFEKIRTRNTPEAIAKWISERRLKFPTGEKVAKQRALNLERLERGEKLEPNTRGRGRGRGFNNRSMRGSFRNAGRGRRNVRDKRRIFKMPFEIVNTNKEDWNGELQPFPGTISIYGEEDSSSSSEEEYSEDDLKDYFEDEEWSGQFAMPVKSEEVKITNSLGALMSMYGSSGESDNEDDSETPEGTNLNNKNEINVVKEQNTVVEIVKTNINFNDTTELSENKKLMNDNVMEQQAIVEPVETNLIVNEDDVDDKGPEETAIVKIKENVISDSLKERTSQNRKRKRNSNVKIEEYNENKSKIEHKRRRMYTVYERLLGKFLNDEIRHERNMLFQIVHYVVDKNFFGVKETKYDEVATESNVSTEEIFYNNIKDSKVKVLL